MGGQGVASVAYDFVIGVLMATGFWGPFVSL